MHKKYESVLEIENLNYFIAHLELHQPTSEGTPKGNEISIFKSTHIHCGIVHTSQPVQYDVAI